MISLARGFSYAGAKSIMTTLWKIPDENTQIIMGDFYQYLKDGLSKHEALRQAKLDYLNDLNQPNRSPLYWAGLIGIGDMSPVVVEKNGWNYTLIFVALGLLLLGLLGLRFLRAKGK